MTVVSGAFRCQQRATCKQWDAENRLSSVSGAVSASFVYDGDGRRVKATVSGVTSYYVGDYYEVAGGVVKKYYSAGGQRIAVRSGGVLHWLLADHLGGTAHTLSGATETGEVRYKAFGVTRFTSGTTPTSYRFTGQREEVSLGLYYYNARWYDPALGHFVQPDSMVPAAGNALDYHRYAYVRFNPLKYEDDSGHCATFANGQADLENDYDCWQLAYSIYGFGQGLADRFAADWRVSPEEWLTNVASQSFADADYLRPFAEQYRTAWSRQAGLPVDSVQWHQPPNYRLLNEPEIIGFLLGERTICETWDCGAISLDLMMLGTQLSRDTALFSMPVTNVSGASGYTVGQLANSTLTITSLTYVTTAAIHERASKADLIVSYTTAAAGFFPVAGEFSTVGQLLWDLFDPLHPW
jgi:RHS repeat-associated protein